MCMPRKARGGHRVLLYRSLLSSLETGSLMEATSRLEGSKFQQSPCLCPPIILCPKQQVTDTHSHVCLYLNTGDSNLGRHASAICVLTY